MSLSSGTKLGPYEITAAIGAGGMGEVYRARDTRLGRDVALKVLPEEFARDSERMARMRREAQVLASLNHSNIAAIYGFEDSGNVHALVMELVEGPTLAEKISGSLSAVAHTTADLKVAATKANRGGAIALEEALPMAKQMAEGLEYAHERGIIHRDLKPSNVKVTPEGQVKVLDFGLAKAIEGDPSTTSVENSPTLSAMATHAGFLLGTAAYMSPEQARGKKADRRADIWAFGVVLFEMLSGKRLFTGETTSDTLAAVIRAEPDWNELPPHTPQAIRSLLARCLKKDPRQRLQSIGDARIAIDEVLSGAPESVYATPAQTKWNRWLPWAVALLLGIITSVFATGYFLRTPPPAAAIISQIEPPENTNFVLTGISAGPPTLSPDGHALAFTAASSDGRRMLWVQNLNSSAARSLNGTDAAEFPFWSPDSRSLGFFAHGKLSRIAASGGPVFAICDAVSARGGAWGTGGTILFGSLTGPLLRVPSSGGTPQQVTKLGEYIISHRWPQFLPDGKHFLFFEQSRSPSSAVSVGSLDGGQPKLLLRNDSSAGYAPPGYLLFVQQGTLMAQHFDAAKLQLVGDAMPLSAQAAVDSGLFRSNFTVSESGILAYASGSMSQGRLLWFDRDGKQLAETGTAGVYGFPRISPDGRKLVVSIAQSGVTIFDLVRGISMRLTFTPDSRAVPVLSPDGKTIAFVSSQNGYGKIYQKNADGTGVTMPLVVDDADNTLPSWSSDGRYLLYQRHSGQIHAWEIWAKPLFGDGKVFPVIQDRKFLEADAALSPDGRWLAHDSEETGSLEVYLTPFLHGGGKWQASANGGACPRWRADGRELFYVSLDNKIMSVEVSEQGSGVVLGAVRPLFQADPVPSVPECMYDVTADGKKFVVVTQAAERKSRPLTLVINWPALLKKQ